ncbi:MAG: choice-of-anchor B family protein [Bacteroidetes bacterium]|nr:choice-of-anchor B family protein [Bacteroidota bacterium]
MKKSTNFNRHCLIFIMQFAFYFSPSVLGGLEWGGGAVAQKNLSLRSSLSMTGSGCWGYVDGLGNEYALIGNGPGLSIVNISDPDTPASLFYVPGYCYIWTEVKTWSTYAYFTSDGCSDTSNGLVIVNLANLPDSINYKTWKGNGSIAGQVHACHTLQIENGYAFLNGCNPAGLLILDLSDPWNPNYIGQYANYVHDCLVRGDTVWTAEIYDGWFAAVDVTDKSNPVLLASQITPNAFTHNVALSDDGNFLFTTDEVAGAYIASYDVSDFSDITELDRYRPSNVISEDEEDHNTYYLNGFLINGDYGNRVTIVDAARPGNLIEVGRYDIDPTPCTTWGCITWDVHPFLPSGNIIASDFNNGMYIFTPTYVRACYLEGTVTDSITGNPLFNVKIEILSTVVTDSTNLTGIYKTGYADAGTYSVRFSKNGYITKTISGVSLNNGVLTTLDVQLWDGTVGIPEFQDSDQMNNGTFIVYLSPGNGKFIIEINDYDIVVQNPEFRLMNIFGQLIFKSAIRNSQSEILTTGFLPGIYFYEIIFSSETVFTGKLVFE